MQNGMVVAYEALKRLRVGTVADEYQLQRMIAVALADAQIPAAPEAKLGPGCRVDFLTEGGIAIEAKKGKPSCRKLASQVERYCRWAAVKGLIIVVERNAWSLPAESAGKPVRYLSLHRNWGIAL